MKVQKLSIYFLIGVSVFLVSNSFGQISHLSNNGGTAGNYVGWNATNNVPLEIRHNGNQDIDFFTDSTQQMTIKNDGLVGIGLANPGHLLELATGGDLNLEDGIIRIGDEEMVVSDGNNIAIGTHSNLQTITTGINNISVGIDAGISITSANNNSFFGENAGEQITTGGSNVFVGFSAGTNMQAGIQNVFLGARSGVLSTGNDNVMVGFNTGTDNTIGEDNVFVYSLVKDGNIVRSETMVSSKH
jgi:hypothetical protein